MSSKGTSSRLRVLEWTMFGLGVGCVAWYLAVRVEVAHFQSRQRAALERVAASRELSGDGGWLLASPSNRAAPILIGELEIPRVGLSATVMEGDDDAVLKVAIGYLPDTPLPWQEGNSALAGHRDSFFRPLQEIRIGDDVRFSTSHGEFRYRVSRTVVVDPEDVWVLDSLPLVNLTLITCFPFSYVGHAPRRFIVQAEKVQSLMRGTSSNAQ